MAQLFGACVGVWLFAWVIESLTVIGASLVKREWTARRLQLHSILLASAVGCFVGFRNVGPEFGLNYLVAGVVVWGGETFMWRRRMAHEALDSSELKKK